MNEQNKQPVRGSFAALMQQQSPPPPRQTAEKPAEKPKQVPQNAEQPKPSRSPAGKLDKKERQLNAWITATQNSTLDRLYFELRAKGIKIKKGELVGVGIEVLAGIFQRFSPKKIDATLLDNFLTDYGKNTDKRQG